MHTCDAISSDRAKGSSLTKTEVEEIDNAVIDLGMGRTAAQPRMREIVAESRKRAGRNACRTVAYILTRHPHAVPETVKCKRCEKDNMICLRTAEGAKKSQKCYTCASEPCSFRAMIWTQGSEYLNRPSRPQYKANEAAPAADIQNDEEEAGRRDDLGGGAAVEGEALTAEVPAGPRREQTGQDASRLSGHGRGEREGDEARGRTEAAKAMKELIELAAAAEGSEGKARSYFVGRARVLAGIAGYDLADILPQLAGETAP